MSKSELPPLHLIAERFNSPMWRTGTCSRRAMSDLLIPLRSLRTSTPAKDSTSITSEFAGAPI
jgi:hypothetical protein